MGLIASKTFVFVFPTCLSVCLPLVVPVVQVLFVAREYYTRGCRLLICVMEPDGDVKVLIQKGAVLNPVI